MSALQQQSSFSAHLALAAGLAVSITADTLAQLQDTVAKLQPAANDGRKDPAPQPEKVAAKVDAGNAPAPTGTQASAPAAASGSASAAEAPRPTYDDVKARVLSLSKVKRELAVQTLNKFGVDHGNKLKLEDYPAFIAAADQALAGAGK